MDFDAVRKRVSWWQLSWTTMTESGEIPMKASTSVFDEQSSATTRHERAPPSPQESGLNRGRSLSFLLLAKMSAIRIIYRHKEKRLKDSDLEFTLIQASPKCKCPFCFKRPAGAKFSIFSGKKFSRNLSMVSSPKMVL